MKISSINFPSFSPKAAKSNVKQNYATKPLEADSVSFSGVLKRKKIYADVEKNFTPETEDIIKKAQLIASFSKDKETQMQHVWAACLIQLINYLNELENGKTTYSESQRYKMPLAIQSRISTSENNILTNEKYRKYIKDAAIKNLKKLQKEYNLRLNTKKLYEASNKKISRFFLPSISDSLKRDLIETSELMINTTDTYTFYDNFLYVSALSSSNKKVAKNSDDFDKDMMFNMISSPVKKNKTHLDMYDAKADAIWKNISMGNDVVILCKNEDMPSSEHLIDSFTNLIKKPDVKYPNVDPENTEIIVTNSYVTMEFLNDLTEKIKRESKNTDKMYVIVTDQKQIFSKLENGTLYAPDLATLTNDDSEKKTHYKIVMITSPEYYYANLESPLIKKAFSKYAIQILPSITAEEANKILTNEKGIEYIKSITKKTYSPETVKKAVELTIEEEGTYPDKAIELLNNTNKYFVDKKEITPEDIIQYTNETKNLTETNNSDKDIEIIYNTGKNLSSIIGSPMTKADAKSIAKQIKAGTIGTKGYIIYQANGESEGGGRRNTVEAIAGETKSPMIVINARDFANKDIDKLVNNASFSEMKIKTIITQAKAQAEMNPNKTAIIFIENFDNFGSNPLYGISSIYEQKAFSQLLSEMEKIRKEGKINLVVIGSVNFPEAIDENIMKPYKFLNSIVVYPPMDEKERKEVIEYYIDKMNLNIQANSKNEEEEIINNLANTTQGFSVVYLMLLLETAKNVSAERQKDKIDSSDFVEAFLQVTTGRANQAKISDHRKKIVTSHEAGHALTLQIMYEIAKKQNIPWHLPDKVNFITLDPRGYFGGAMYFYNSGNEEMSFEKIMSDIICSYGGHSSEKILYNMKGSYGITADMQVARKDAKAAVVDMGMGKNTGVCHIERNRLGELAVSEAKLQTIEEDTDLILKTSEEISNKIIETYKGFIEEFTEKHWQKAGSGDSIITSDEFIQELEEWRNKQDKLKKDELTYLEDKITSEINKIKS